jgi:hypothetical protein
MKTLATAYRACSGHEKNQSMPALLTMPICRRATHEHFYGYSNIAYHTREVTTSRPQHFADRGHGHDDVQVVGAFVDEELPDALAGRS